MMNKLKDEYNKFSEVAKPCGQYRGLILLSYLVILPLLFLCQFVLVFLFGPFFGILFSVALAFIASYRRTLNVHIIRDRSC